MEETTGKPQNILFFVVKSLNRTTTMLLCRISTKIVSKVQAFSKKSQNNSKYYYVYLPMPTWPLLRDDSGITRVLFGATRGLLAHHLVTLVCFGNACAVLRHSLETTCALIWPLIQQCVGFDGSLTSTTLLQ